HVGARDVPRQVEIVEEILVLLVPAARYRDRAGVRQAVEPAFLFPDVLGVDLEVPDAGQVQLITAVVLLWIKHRLLLSPRTRHAVPPSRRRPPTRRRSTRRVRTFLP